MLAVPERGYERPCWRRWLGGRPVITAGVLGLYTQLCSLPGPARPSPAQPGPARPAAPHQLHPHGQTATGRDSRCPEQGEASEARRGEARRVGHSSASLVQSPE